MKTVIGLLLCLVVGAELFAQVETRSYITDDKLIPREHNVDMQHMKLELELKPNLGMVIGKVTHTFITLQTEVTSLFLDATGITVKKIMLDDADAKFTTDEKGITVLFSPMVWGSVHNIVITYQATPKMGLYFVGWNDPKNLSRKQIWSQGQGIDNRHWIPFYDEMNDKLTTEMIVTFDSNYKVLSNGVKLKEKDNKNGTTTWHYKMSHPHAPYLVMLGIGAYDIKESKSKSGVPMNFWYYPEYQNRVDWTYKYSEDMMDFFEETIGVKYPWESYSQIPVQEFMFGAMENTTATVYGDFYHIDSRAYLDKNYVRTNAHELAHQWFGDLVTARSSTHHWLQESFATYYNMLYENRVFGQDHYDWKRREATEGAINESIKNAKPIAHSTAGVVRHYPKGAHVLHMLKYVVGEEQYNAAIKYYLEKHAYKNVDSEDLLIAFHERLGLSLDWFWDQWVYRGGEPEYNVEFSEVTIGTKKQTVFEVHQTHITNDVVTLFKMPIFFEVHYTDGTSNKEKVWIESAYQSVAIDNPNKEIDYVLFDPNSEVMKQVKFNKPFDMLVSQAIKAKWMLDRYDAVVALREFDITKKRDVLIEAYQKEKHHYIKNEILDQLMNDSHPKTIGIIRSAITDNDRNVRLKSVDGVLLGLAPLTEDYEKLLSDSSYDVVIKTLEHLSLAYPTNVERYLEVTKNEIGADGKNVRIKWLEIVYNSNKKDQFIQELISYSSQSFEFRTRVNAINSIKMLNYFNETILINTINALESPNSRLANPCGEVLQYFYNQSAYKPMIRNYFVEHPLELNAKIERYLQ